LSCYLSDVPPEQIIEVAEGVYQKGKMQLDEIIKYLDIVEPYCNRIVRMAIQLGILEEQEGVYQVSTEAKDLAVASIDQRPTVFKRFIADFKPFVLFCYYLLRENAVEVASRKVGVVCDIRANPNVILKTLRSLGIYSGLLKEESNGKFIIDMDERRLEETYIRELLKATQDVFNANLFIAYKVGDEIFGYLEREDRRLIVESLTKYSQNPKDAINYSGQAFESFLRHIGNLKNVDLTKKNGILEVANELKGKDVILEEHRKMSEFLSAFRNPADHGIHKQILEHWVVEKDSALEVVLLFLTAMRSYYRFALNRELIL
jgi:hypothetical protein